MYIYDIIIMTGLYNTAYNYRLSDIIIYYLCMYDIKCLYNHVNYIRYVYCEKPVQHILHSHNPSCQPFGLPGSMNSPTKNRTDAR